MKLKCLDSDLVELISGYLVPVGAGRDQPCAGLCHSFMVRVRVRVTQKNKSQSQDFDFFFKLQSKVIT